MSINITKPETQELKPRITVIGVGGAGCNAVNNMIASHLEGVEFVIANTDAQSLSQSACNRKIQLGAEVTEGLGAGASPDTGRLAALESMDTVMQQIEGTHMLFITAGMGGGTGTGAAPVIAEAAREKGILTVGVATRPFEFEGKRRMEIAEQGIAEFSDAVDTLIVIPNQNLFRIANAETTFTEAFRLADEVLYSGVRGVTDLMMMPGLINLDFADVRAVMMDMGNAMMGTGESEGEARAGNAAAAAISNPLLDDVSLAGAQGVLVNITGGPDLKLYEVDEIVDHIRKQVDDDVNLIFGATNNESSLEGKIRVSVVATGISRLSETDSPEVNNVEQLNIRQNDKALKANNRNGLNSNKLEADVAVLGNSTKLKNTAQPNEFIMPEPISPEKDKSSIIASKVNPFEEAEMLNASSNNEKDTKAQTTESLGETLLSRLARAKNIASLSLLRENNTSNKDNNLSRKDSDLNDFSKTDKVIEEESHHDEASSIKNESNKIEDYEIKRENTHTDTSSLKEEIKNIIESENISSKEPELTGLSSAEEINESMQDDALDIPAFLRRQRD